MVRYSYYVPAKRAIIIIIIKLSPYGWTHNKRANGWLPVASYYGKYHQKSSNKYQNKYSKYISPNPNSENLNSGGSYLITAVYYPKIN